MLLKWNSTLGDNNEPCTLINNYLMKELLITCTCIFILIRERIYYLLRLECFIKHVLHVIKHKEIQFVNTYLSWAENLFICFHVFNIFNDSLVF